MFLAACIQLRCTSDIERNLSTAEALIERAARAAHSLGRGRLVPSPAADS